MTAFVEECRHEWTRLGVPDLLAEEMATDLEADLAEAEADGVAAAEFLGESDPRRFAASWAKERGLVREPPPEIRRRRRWPWIAVGVILAFVFVIVLGILAATGASMHTHVTLRQPQAVRSIVIPSFVGLKACHAERVAAEMGLKVRTVPRGRCNAVVVGQMPTRGTLIPLPPRLKKRATVTLRLRS